MAKSGLPIIKMTAPRTEMSKSRLVILGSYQISAGHISDVVYDPKHGVLTVRTDDLSAPVKVYSLKPGSHGNGPGYQDNQTGNEPSQLDSVSGVVGDGPFLEFGADIKLLNEYGCLTLDSRRNLYLAACEGHLTTVTREGVIKDKLQMDRCWLYGVAYLKQEDKYVVSDVNNHVIHIIDPRDMTIAWTFGRKGANTGQFNTPCGVTSYTEDGRTVLAISDTGNHRVQLVDIYGTHVHTYGWEGVGEGELRRPLGVVYLGRGRIVVCDYDNRRVVTFWRKEDRGQGWKCLLSPEQLPGKPSWVDINAAERTLAIQSDKIVRLYKIGAGK